MHRHDPWLYLQQMAQAQQNAAFRYYGTETIFSGGLGMSTALLYSGLGQIFGDPYAAAQGYGQTHLGTPVALPPAPADPEEIAWLKGRVNEYLWRPR